MDVKLFDSELKVMSVLWRDGDVPAKHIAKQLTEELGWNGEYHLYPDQALHEEGGNRTL